MGTSLKTAAAGTVTAMVLGGAVLTGTTGAQASSGRQLAGTWVVSVDPEPPTAPSFTSTIVYTDGGSVVETTMNRPPSAISTGLGTWERLGDGQYAVMHRKFRWAPDGTFAGTVVVREVSQVAPDGETFVARATATFYRPDGSQDSIPPLTSNVTGERL